MIGVLALQGAFLEHIQKFNELGVPCREVRTPAELSQCVGLVIPGGESTAISLLASRLGMLEPLREWSRAKKPSWGTCAGMIMLAERAEGQKAGGQPLIGGLDISVSRNYFGSQTSSFEAPLELSESIDSDLLSDKSALCHGVFIRAPAILQCGEGVRPLAHVRVPRKDAQVPASELGHRGGCDSGSAVSPVCVAAASDSFLVTAFHPELSQGAGWHKIFVTMVEKATGLKILPQTGGGTAAGKTLPVDFNADVITSGNKFVYDISRRVVAGSTDWQR